MENDEWGKFKPNRLVKLFGPSMSDALSPLKPGVLMIIIYFFFFKFFFPFFKLFILFIFKISFPGVLLGVLSWFLCLCWCWSRGGGNFLLIHEVLSLEKCEGKFDLKGSNMIE